MKRNFIKKTLLYSVIISICFCMCFINVKADTPNLRDEYDLYPEDYNIFDFYSTPNSFKGKTLYLTPLHNMTRVFRYIDNGDNTDFYITWENNELINTRYNFSIVESYTSPNRDSSTYDLVYCYGFRFTTNFDDGMIYRISILTSDNTWVRIFESNDGGISYVNSDYYFDKSMLINFPLSEDYDIIFYSPQITEENVADFNADFGLSHDYDYGVFGIITLFLFDNSMPVIPNHLLNAYERYSNIEITQQLVNRYEQGFQNGYTQGLEDSGNNQYRIPFLTGIFNGVNDILNIEVFPNIKLSYFIFIPLVLGITGMILWFWRKD